MVYLDSSNTFDLPSGLHTHAHLYAHRGMHTHRHAHTQYV